MCELAGCPPDCRGSPGSRCAAEQAVCIQVLIHIGPVDAESSAGYAPVRALFGSRRKETGIPYEWYRDCTTVQEINNQDVVRKPDILHALTRPTF